MLKNTQLLFRGMQKSIKEKQFQLRGGIAKILIQSILSKCRSGDYLYTLIDLRFLILVNVGLHQCVILKTLS
jgi:hypothetical protein